MPDIFIGDKPKEPEIKEGENQNTDSEPLVEVNTAPASPLPNNIGKKPRFFASYSAHPNGINLTEKFEQEELLLFLRKHFITNFPWLFIAFLASLVPILILITFTFGIVSITLFPVRFSIIITIFYYFFIFSGYMFVCFITWFYNISIVTNERVVDIEFSSLVFEHVAATKLSQLEDVSYAQIGIVRSVFDYGDVNLQTAGTLPEFEFLAVPHPEKIIKIINNLIGKEDNV
jgi:hypothetical protein